ncbi:MerR family transcriptional regulator [Herbaspirillum camelliae]|uniref:MerR family transcriptional regulator n=1 Tax=Herbaspirillum camelliae TaxID=1892903 RepID=UPI000949F5CE|nr:MerR family transcriptional regulator [Herbaspirillum camelliae]
MTTSLTIAQAAQATGLSVHTLRYYERIGLLDPVERRDNHHRRYTQEDLDWIAFLKKLKATGLPVRAMLRYAELRRAGNTMESVSQRKALLQAHTLCVQHTLAELQDNLAVLQHKLVLYEELEQQAGAAGRDTAASTSQPERMAS